MAVWSIINKSEGLSNKRIDSERYKPQYTENEYLLRNIPHKKLKYYINDISGGATPRGAKYSLSGIPFIRVQNIKENYSDLTDVVYIHESIHNGELFRSQIKEEDVLLTITGVSYGNSTVAHKKMLPANMNQHSVRISLKNALLPEFLSTFFVSKYGKLQSDSRVTGDTRPALTYSEISNIIIPDIIIENQLKIKDIVIKATGLRILSQELYNQAIDLLEQELGLDTIELNKRNNYITSNSICVNERIIDPKFHNPIYAKLSNHLEENFDTVELRKIADIEYGYMPMQDYETDSNKGIPLIRVTNITQQIEIKMDELKYIPNWVKIPTKKYVEKGDILVVQCGDTTGKVGYIYEDVKNHLFPSFCFSVKVKDNRINSLYLAALLKTKIMQILFDQTVMINTVRPNTTKPRFERLTIPILNAELQKTVSDLLIQSNKDKKESKRLLEEAKTRVEQLIEEAANKN